MPKKKPESEDMTASMPVRAQAGDLTRDQAEDQATTMMRLEEVAPDAETESGVEMPAAPAIVEGTIALPARNPKADPPPARSAADLEPTTALHSGNTTRPIAVENLSVPTKREASSPPVPEDSTQAIHKPKDTGPLKPEPAHASRPRVGVQDFEPASSSIPAWVWALLGGAGALVLAGGGFFAYTRLTGRASAPASEPTTTAEAAPSEEAGAADPEVPSAIRSYAEMAKHGKTPKERADAMVYIGYMYAEGINVPKDIPEARKWYKKANELGHKLAADWIKANPEPAK